MPVDRDRHSPDPKRAAPVVTTLSSTVELLERASTEVLWRDASLQRSYKDPAVFFDWLLRALRAEVPALRSQPGIGFDLFFDLFLARPAPERPALRYYVKESGWATVTRHELAVGAARLAARWQQAGAVPGTQVALLFEMGPELLFALAAAFKAGLVPTLIPPRGSAFIQRRLRQSRCLRIATAPLLHHTLSLQAQWRDLLLPPIGDLHSGPKLGSTHLYPDAAPVLTVFSVASDVPDVPLPLAARQTFFLALRDGLLGLRLRDGDHVSCIGGEFLQYQPALLMAALLAGATYVHVADADLAGNPRLAVAYPLRALLLSADGAAQLARGPRGLLSTVHALFCDAAQEASAASWRATLAPLGELPPLFAMLYDSAAGGLTLFSGRQPEHGLFSLVPPPGVPFALQPTAGEAGTAPRAGGFVPTTQPWGSALLVEMNGGYAYLGTLAARRGGHTFPSADVLDVAQQVRGLDAAVIVALPPLGSALDSRFHLVGFSSESPGEITKQLTALLSAQLPARYIPDAIVVLPLLARRKSGKVDLVWVRSQYLQGRLQRKATDTLFQRLVALRVAARQPSLAAMSAAQT